MTTLNSLSQAELIALVQKQQAQLEQAATSKLTLKVGQSGTVCLYHGARYPIALYAEQWERIIPFVKSGALDRFIEANKATLSRKG